MNKITIGFALYSVAVCGLAWLYISWVKNKYVKEVTLLTFLNKEMLFENKRVESFLKKLSKSSR